MFTFDDLKELLKKCVKAEKVLISKPFVSFPLRIGRVTLLL